jgi:hypothetical protein
MSPTTVSRLSLFAAACLMALSCATAPKRQEAAAPRMKDSAPEKVAAQRAGGPHELQQLEQDDERWGIEAAKERKRQRDEAKAREQPAGAGKSVDVTPSTPAK